MTDYMPILFTCMPASSHSRCCCSYLEQSAPSSSCDVRIFYVCFSESSEGFSLQAFIPMTFTATFVVPCHLRTL